MKRIAVLGAGNIGSTVAGMLADCGDYAVTLADSRPAAPSRDPRIRRVLLDASDPAALAAVLAGQFAVLSAAPYHLTATIAAAAKAAGVHYLDLTEDVASTRAVKALAIGAETAFIPQCGLAPGFISIVAADFARRFDALHDVR
ncbi:MAG TPA: saccharopine dehydrogenase NADP-binding domain-containing protein, partial [Caulobacteraceae bacterium]